MKYVATIKYSSTDGFSKFFDEETEAQKWLDSQNNNAEYKTTIDTYDDNWNYIDGYTYTN